MKLKIHKDSFKTCNCGCWNENKDVLDPQTLAEMDKVFEEFNDNDIFIDAGANTGLMSLHLKNGAGIAIEVEPNIFRVLKENIKLNYKEVTCLNEALYNEVVGYSIKSSDWGGTTCIEIMRNVASSTTTTGDNIVKQYVDEKENVKMIKIDCEEVSEKVLQGFIETIKKYHPVVIVEAQGGVKKDWFNQFGYDISKIKHIENNFIVK